MLPGSAPRSRPCGVAGEQPRPAEGRGALNRPGDPRIPILRRRACTIPWPHVRRTQEYVARKREGGPRPPRCRAPPCAGRCRSGGPQRGRRRAPLSRPPPGARGSEPPSAWPPPRPSKLQPEPQKGERTRRRTWPPLEDTRPPPHRAHKERPTRGPYARARHGGRGPRPAERLGGRPPRQEAPACRNMGHLRRTVAPAETVILGHRVGPCKKRHADVRNAGCEPS